MSAPSSDEAFWSLREAVMTGDFTTVVSLLDSGHGELVTDPFQHEEILIYCFGSAETYNSPDVDKLKMWYVISSAWYDTVRAKASLLLREAVYMAPLEIFEELLQTVEETVEPIDREGFLKYLETSVRTPAHESKRKAAFDRAGRAVAESIQAKQAEKQAEEAAAKKLLKAKDMKSKNKRVLWTKLWL